MSTKFNLSTISDFYNKNKQTIQILIIICLIIVCIISIKSCMKNQITTRNLQIANDSLNMKIVEYVDENGKVHAQVNVLELSNKDLKSLNTNLKVYYENKIDSLADILKIKSKTIQEYITIISKSTGTGKGRIDTIYNTKTEYIDTTYNFNSNDGYLVYNGFVDKKGFNYNYTYTDKLQLTKFYKKKGLFGWRKEYYWDATLSNTNASITGLEQFSKPTNSYKRFALVVGTSYGINPELRLKWFPITFTIGYKLAEF